MINPCLYLLEDVQKLYGSITALRIARLEVFAGEILCLVGPTGAGKSTLLRLLSGLEPPTTGHIAFEQQRFEGRGAPLEVLRRITMVFQRPLLLTGSVRTNVEYGLRLRGRNQPAAKTQEVIDRLGLAKLASQSAQTLSGGQIQLVALARALVLQPDVLLLDEPTAHLDPACVAVAEEIIREYQHQHGATVVLATHNIFQARRLAQRVGLLLDGQVVEVAPTQTFFESPTDGRTAAFIQGKMVY